MPNVFRYEGKLVNAALGNNRCLHCDHTKPVNILCGENAEILKVKVGGTYKLPICFEQLTGVLRTDMQ